MDGSVYLFLFFFGGGVAVWLVLKLRDGRVIFGLGRAVLALALGWSDTYFVWKSTEAGLLEDGQQPTLYLLVGPAWCLSQWNAVASATRVHAESLLEREGWEYRCSTMTYHGGKGYRFETTVVMRVRPETSSQDTGRERLLVSTQLS